MHKFRVPSLLRYHRLDPACIEAVLHPSVDVIARCNGSVAVSLRAHLIAMQALQQLASGGPAEWLSPLKAVHALTAGAVGRAVVSSVLSVNEGVERLSRCLATPGRALSGVEQVLLPSLLQLVPLLLLVCSAAAIFTAACLQCCR